MCLSVGRRPVLKGLHVVRRWRHQEECLAALDHMIPDGAAPKVHMEVCVAACGTHESVQQYLHNTDTLALTEEQRPER